MIDHMLSCGCQQGKQGIPFLSRYATTAYMSVKSAVLTVAMHLGFVGYSADAVYIAFQVVQPVQHC